MSWVIQTFSVIINIFLTHCWVTHKHRKCVINMVWLCHNLAIGKASDDYNCVFKQSYVQAPWPNIVHFACQQNPDTLHSLNSTIESDIQYFFCITCTFEVLKVRLGLGIIVLTFFGQWDIKFFLTLTPNFRAVCWRKSISQNHLGAPLHWSRKIIIQYSGKE